MCSLINEKIIQDPKKYNYNIYKIVCKDLNIHHSYIGSTRSWKQRKFCHKQRTYDKNQKSYNYPVYKCIREFGGWENWDMIQIESAFCAKREAESLERKWIEVINSDLNSKKRPYITEEERKNDQKKFQSEYKKKFPEKILMYGEKYREDNKEEIKNWKKEYYQKNKEKLKEKGNNYYKDNKEKVLENVKKYAEKNKDKIKEYNKEYHEKNKESLKKYREDNREKYQKFMKNYNKEYKEKNKAKLNKKINCECGSIYSYRSKSEHKKTKKHQKYLQSLETDGVEF